MCPGALSHAGSGITARTAAAGCAGGSLATAASNKDPSCCGRPCKSVSDTAIVTALEQRHHGKGKNKQRESNQFLFHDSFPCCTQEEIIRRELSIVFWGMRPDPEIDSESSSFSSSILRLGALGRGDKWGVAVSALIWDAGWAEHAHIQALPEEIKHNLGAESRGTQDALFSVVVPLVPSARC